VKAIQYFNDEYLQQCRGLTPDQIIAFLDDFRQLHGNGAHSPSKLIRVKVPEDSLNAFKTQGALAGTRNKTQIKELMKARVLESKVGAAGNTGGSNENR
jgi:hypothetical protein